MDKKTMAIIGVGVIGAGALILMSPPPTYQPGGVGGISKKEEAAAVGPVTTETVTETTETPAVADPIYNILFPDPSFPTIPEAPMSEPWWVEDLDPPDTSTKKNANSSPARGVEPDIAPARGVEPDRVPTRGILANGSLLRFLSSVGYTPYKTVSTKKSTDVSPARGVEPDIAIAGDLFKRLGRR